MTTPATEGQTAPAGGSDFGSLLAEMEALAKSHAAPPQDGAGAGAGAGEGQGAGGTPGTEAGAENDDEELFGKSLTVKLADGTEAEALDGEAMLKALRTLRSENKALRGDVTTGQAQFGEARDAINALGGVVKAQDVLLKSLAVQLDKVSNQGRGRATTLSIAERVPGTNAPAKPSRQDILSKSLSLVGKSLVSSDVGMIEGCLNNGVAIPDHLQRALDAG